MYNTFPDMEGHIFPEEAWKIVSPRASMENAASVQFHHRMLALSTALAAPAVWWLHRNAPLPSPVKCVRQ